MLLEAETDLTLPGQETVPGQPSQVTVEMVHRDHIMDIFVKYTEFQGKSYLGCEKEKSKITSTSLSLAKGGWFFTRKERCSKFEGRQYGVQLRS